MPEESRRGTSDGSGEQSLKKGGASIGTPSGRRNLFWMLLILLLFVWIWGTMNGMDPQTEINYSTFRAELADGNVERITVRGEEVRGELREARETRVGDELVSYHEFTTHLPPFGHERLMELLEAEGVTIESEPESDFSWWLILFYAVPLLFIIFLFVLLMRGMQSQGQQMFSMGKSRAKTYKKGEGRETFADVAGQTEAKYELQEVVAFLKDPGQFESLGGEIPRGVLLVGPPGTGKTLLARAVAGEADVPFYSLSGSDFMEMLVGVGASRVRDLFKEAKETAPSIIFIDELDSIGRRRGAGLGGGHDEREQTLNQLLSEMDGFEPNEGVVVMAATNRPDILDPALLRPGRFDRQVTVGLPTRQDRVEILGIHARRKPLDQDVELDEIARSTPGFSGADLKNLMNESALLAARKGKTQIQIEDIEEARDKVLLGLERKSMVLTEEERTLLAYHEAGHAIVAAVVPHADPVHKVTIIPRGQAMGVTQQLPTRDRFLYSRNYLLDRLAVVMGGRAAEDLVLDTATSGAEDDLQQASRMARQMVLKWGMSERFGRLASGGDREQVFLGEEIAQRRDYSEATAREADEEIRRIVDEAYDRARSILSEERDGLDALATALLEEEEVAGRRVYGFVGRDYPVEPEDRRSPGRSETVPGEAPAGGVSAPAGRDLHRRDGDQLDHRPTSEDGPPSPQPDGSHEGDGQARTGSAKGEKRSSTEEARTADGD